tara:strand:- start:402 stop:620 length:219 start_codon:yes stop_codon:yes gene_type:complete
MRKYVVINTSEVSVIDFSKVEETSQYTLRFSADESKTFVKFEGDTPSQLEGKTQYSHSEMLDILATDEWTGL